MLSYVLDILVKAARMHVLETLVAHWFVSKMEKLFLWVLSAGVLVVLSLNIQVHMPESQLL